MIMWWHQNQIQIQWQWVKGEYNNSGSTGKERSDRSSILCIDGKGFNSRHNARLVISFVFEHVQEQFDKSAYKQKGGYHKIL